MRAKLDKKREIKGGGETRWARWLVVHEHRGPRKEQADRAAYG